MSVGPGENTLYPVNQQTQLALAKFEDDPSGRALVRLEDRDALNEDEWTATTDLITGEAVEVRRADCGLGCRCAGEVRLAYVAGAVPAGIRRPDPGGPQQGLPADRATAREAEVP